MKTIFKKYGWMLLVIAVVAGIYSIIKVLNNNKHLGGSGIHSTIDSLRTELDSTKAAYRILKMQSDDRLEELGKRIDSANHARQDIERRLNRMVVKDPLEWLRSLPASERDNVVSHINGKIAEEL